MNLVRKPIDLLIFWVCSLWLLVMVGAACWQIISRFYFNSPGGVTEEFLRFSLVWLSMIGLAYVAGQRKHVAFTLLVDGTPRHWRRYWEIMIELTFLAFAVYVLIIGGLKAVNMTMMQTSPALRLPMGYVYLAMPISGGLLAFYSLLNCIQLFLKQISPAPHMEEPSQDV